MSVRTSGSDSEQLSSSSAIPHRLYVGNIPMQVPPDRVQLDFRSYFSRYGAIVDISLHHNRSGEYYSFVELEDEETVCEIIADCHVIYGKELVISRAFACRKQLTKSSPNKNPAKLFVRGFREALGEQELRAYFSAFAPVLKVVLPTKKVLSADGTRFSINRKFAYVYFENALHAEAVKNGTHCLAGDKLIIESATSAKPSRLRS